ncbi:MAG: hypothetical protein PSV17_05495, partial [Methylotenera sp.]|uniref:beta strand repeat-containing protein n=1 Tax=Methylotenera sp. TaxID=2051956 RepID=UPI00248A0551
KVASAEAYALVAGNVANVSFGVVDPTVGQTFTLTTGVDSGALFTGTAGNDTFTALQSDAGLVSDTFGAADTISGGLGTDSLNVILTGAATATTLAAATVSGIENINVRAVQATAATITSVTAANFAGATDFNADRATSAITFNGLAAGQKVGMIGNGSIVNGAVTANYANTVTAGVFNISGGTGTAKANATGVLTQTGTGITSNTINSTGGDNYLNNVVLSGTSNVALTINAATNLTTGNITGFTGTTSTITVAGAATSVDIGTLQNTTVKTVNASGLTAGGVTTTLNTNTGINFVGGAGNDVVTAGAVLVTGASVDAGAGTADRLVITADAQLTTATAPFYKGFEVLQANTGVTADASQLAANNTITGVRVNDSAGAAVTVNGLNATMAANVAIIAANDAAGAITLGLTGASNGGQIDTVKAALTTTNAAGTAQVSNLTGLSLVGVEKLELTGNGTVGATTGAVTLTTTSMAAIDSIKLVNAGVNSITIAAQSVAANLNVDATGSTGATTINATAYNSTTGATITGGSGNDVIGGSQRVDTIIGGNGNDVIIGDSSAEVQAVTFTGNTTGNGTLVIAGQTVTLVAATQTTATLSAAKAATDITASIAAGTGGDIITATSAGAVLTLTYSATAGNVATSSAALGTADTITFGVAVVTDGAINLVGDILTGGAGNDVFHYGAGAANTVANADTIVGLDLGTATTAVDTFVFGNANGAKSVVVLSTAQQATVTAAANLAAATDVAMALMQTDGATTTFTFGTETYLLHNGDAGATYTATADYIVKITGVVGTLDVGDFSVV